MEWPWAENLPVVEFQPRLRSLSLQLTLRDLTVLQDDELRLPPALGELYLHFSTWLPVGMRINDSVLGSASLPPALKLLHVTFDWRDSLGVGAKALPSVLPSDLRSLQLTANGASFPSGLPALGCLPKSLKELTLSLSGCRGVGPLLALLELGLPPGLERLTADLSWCDVLDADVCGLFKKLPVGLRELDVVLAHCNPLPQAAAELAQNLPEGLESLKISFAYTYVQGYSLEVLTNHIPFSLKRMSLDFSGNELRCDSAGSFWHLPPSLRSCTLRVHDCVVDAALLLAARSARPLSPGLALEASKCHLREDTILAPDMDQVIVVQETIPEDEVA